MTKLDKIKKTLHFASTAWLVLTFFYVFVNALRFWGLKWWVIFSLSGYSLLVVLLLISFYLFAIYNSLIRNKKIEKEHPLTRSSYYMSLYEISPFIGVFAALFAITSADNLAQALTVLSIGTFAVTFIFWIIVDPLLNIIESSLPQSRLYRKQRLELEKHQKIKHQQQQERLINELQQKENELIDYWDKKLTPLSQALCDVLQNKNGVQSNQIIDYGLKAWQIGGRECMVLLKSKSLEMLSNNNLADNLIAKNLIEINWNGIGEWNTHLTNFSDGY